MEYATQGIIPLAMPLLVLQSTGTSRKVQKSTGTCGKTSLPLGVVPQHFSW